MSELAAFKYSAFLSYSHTDAGWAKWLHAKLEGFRIDKDLVGRETTNGQIPKTLRPIFRDREDFTVGHTLNEQTLDALGGSAALIVLCSPASAKSHYVNEEVRFFKSQHSERPVLPIIIGGKPDDPNEECFCPALKFKIAPGGEITATPEEPLAADVREEGDGKNLALAKLVAGLLGVPSDDIFRRAEQARRQRLQLISATTLFILVVVLSLAFLAWLQRTRFDNYLTLANDFRAFSVADETQGWQNPQQLAQQTLEAMRRVVSKRPFSRLRILWFDDKPALSLVAKQTFLTGMRGIGVAIQEEADIGRAKEAVKQNFDVVIANYGNPKRSICLSAPY